MHMDGMDCIGTYGTRLVKRLLNTEQNRTDYLFDVS